MKRFTETTKWDDNWFRIMPGIYKAFLQFIWDRCDAAGVWMADMQLAKMYVDPKITAEEAIKHFRGRVVDIGSGKWLVPGFIPFQYGELREGCNAHRPALRLVTKHGLEKNGKGYGKGTKGTLPQGYAKGTQGNLPMEVTKGNPQDQDQDQDKTQTQEEGVQGEIPPPPEPPPEIAILAYLNEKAGRKFTETAVYLGKIRGRLADVKGDIAGIKTMIDRKVAEWRGGHMESWLTPDTLFGPEKFRKYYDDRNQPVFRDTPQDIPGRNKNY